MFDALWPNKKNAETCSPTRIISAPSDALLFTEQRAEAESVAAWPTRTSTRGPNEERFEQHVVAARGGREPLLG